MRDTKALARHYDNLTPQGRFRLILAAGSRGDQAERDRLVIGAARDAGVPLVTVLAGGYAADVNDTVDIHTATIQLMLGN